VNGLYSIGKPVSRAVVTGLGSGAGLGYSFSECKYDFEHNLRHGRPVLRRSKQAQEAISNAAAIGSEAAVESAQLSAPEVSPTPAPEPQLADGVSSVTSEIADAAPAEGATIAPEAAEATALSESNDNETNQ